MEITETRYELRSTEYLELLAKHDCHLTFERSSPAGPLKRDLITIRHRDGRYMTLTTPLGFRKSPVELPREVFDDFVRARLIEQLGTQDQDGILRFGLTLDGRKRGLNIAH
jgi:hypothetical protein